MVPENIHTSPTEGIGNSRGVGGGVKGPGNSGEGGGSCGKFISVFSRPVKSAENKGKNI